MKTDRRIWVRTLTALLLGTTLTGCFDFEATSGTTDAGTDSHLGTDSETDDQTDTEPSINLSCVSEQIAHPGLGDALVTAETSVERDDFASSCGGAASSDVAYYWKAPFNDYYVFDTSEANYNTVLALYSECGGTELDCNQDTAAALTSEIVRKFRAGDEVVVVVDGWSGEQGTAPLDIQRVQCPTIDLEGQPLPHNNSTLGAGDRHGGDCGGNGFADKAFHWVPAKDGLYRFTVTSDEFKPAVYVENGPVCGSALLGCNAAAEGSFGAEVVRQVDAGRPLTIIVDGQDGQGALSLEIQELEAATCPESSSVINMSNCTGAGNVCVSGEILTQRLLSPSCSPAVSPNGVFAPFSHPDMSYTLEIPGIESPGSGNCKVSVEGDGPLVAYILNEDCGGDELQCVTATESGGTHTAEVNIDVADTKRSYVLVVSAASWITPTSYSIALGCAMII